MKPFDNEKNGHPRAVRYNRVWLYKQFWKRLHKRDNVPETPLKKIAKCAL
jgi:hypothetical protein